MGRRGRSNLAEESFFFVTTSVAGHTHVFTEDSYCDILVNQIRRWQSHFGFVILGYVIMATHFHWIVEVQSKRGTISDVMREIKAHTAWEVMDQLQKDGRWRLHAFFSAASVGFADQKRRFWTKRFDDQVIRNQKMFMVKLNYIHNNPVKAGLVQRPEDYKYSSARNYVLGVDSVLPVDTSYMG